MEVEECLDDVAQNDVSFTSTCQICSVSFQTVPVLLTPAFLQRACNNFMVIEVLDKTTPPVDDKVRHPLMVTIMLV